MKDGAIVELGSASDVLLNPSHPYTRTLLASVPGRHWNPAEVRRAHATVLP
jgi:peptide/nickel transport system ATP-binding protein